MYTLFRSIFTTDLIGSFFASLLLAGVCLAGAGCDGGGANGGPEQEDTTPPSAPSDLSASPSNGTVALSWDGVDDASTYNVYRDTASTNSISGSPLDTDVSETSYEDSDATNGTTYYYRVTAVDSADNESDGSSEVEGIPFAPPSDLAGTSRDAEIGLSWVPAAGAARYNVYRSTSSTDGIDGEPLAAGVSDTTYTDEDATNGTTYYYRVTSVNPKDAESTASDEVSKTPFDDPPNRP
jgi:fibronectin type 3 domain-containing protein